MRKRIVTVHRHGQPPGTGNLVRALAMTLVLASSCLQPAHALVLGGDEDLGDGTLTAADGSIRTQSVDGITFKWSDSNGDGTPGDPAAAGLNMAGFSLTRTTDNTGIVLDLNNGTGNGSITNGGTITTSRNPTPGITGSVTIQGVNAVSLHTIRTSPTAGFVNSGSITISGATDITVTNLETATTSISTYVVGGITVTQSGSFRANGILTTAASQYTSPADKSFTGGGTSAGTFTVNQILGQGGTALGNVLIQAYRGVVIGSGGIDLHNYGTLAQVRYPGSITIRNIGADGVLATGLLDASSNSQQNPGSALRPVTITNVAGTVSTGNIFTHVDGAGSWCNRHSGDILISAQGKVQTGDLSTFWNATSTGYRAGSLAVTSSAGPVIVGAINATNSANISANYAGSANLSAFGDLTIRGSVDLNAAYGGTRSGNLVLTTSMGSRGIIRVGNAPSDVLDCARLNAASFNSDGKASYVIGSLTNFGTAATAGAGTPFDPFVTTQTTLRAPSDQRVYYTYIPGGLNDYLGGRAYRLASLAGLSGQGGTLVMVTPRGTVVLFR